MADKSVRFIIKRQPTPESRSHWEEFDLRWRPGMNVIIGLMDIAENPVDRFGIFPGFFLPESTQHGGRYRRRVLLFDSAHHHAQMSRLNDYAYAARIDGTRNCFGNLCGGLNTCLMLTFLATAQRRELRVVGYEASAQGAIEHSEGHDRVSSTSQSRVTIFIIGGKGNRRSR